MGTQISNSSLSQTIAQRDAAVVARTNEQSIEDSEGNSLVSVRFRCSRLSIEEESSISIDSCVTDPELWLP